MNLAVNGQELNPEEVIVTRNEMIPDDLLSLRNPVYEYELEFLLTSPVIGTMDVSQEMMDKLIRPLQTKAQISVNYDGEYRTYTIHRRDYKRNRIHLAPGHERNT